MGFKFKGINHQQPGFTKLSGVFETSATGELSAGTLDFPGVLSWTRIAQGRFRITLEDNYPALLGVDINALNGTARGWRFQIHSEQVFDGSTPYVDVLFSDFASPANNIDPASTELYIEISLRGASLS